MWLEVTCNQTAYSEPEGAPGVSRHEDVGPEAIRWLFGREKFGAQSDESDDGPRWLLLPEQRTAIIAERPVLVQKRRAMIAIGPPKLTEQSVVFPGVDRSS